MTDLATIVITSSELDGAGMYCSRTGCIWQTDWLDGYTVAEVVQAAQTHISAHAFEAAGNRIASLIADPNSPEWKRPDD